jgi:hypothetical protein
MSKKLRLQALQELRKPPPLTNMLAGLHSHRPVRHHSCCSNSNRNQPPNRPSTLRWAAQTKFQLERPAFDWALSAYCGFRWLHACCVAFWHHIWVVPSPGPVVGCRPSPSSCAACRDVIGAGHYSSPDSEEGESRFDRPPKSC